MKRIILILAAVLAFTHADAQSLEGTSWFKIDKDDLLDLKNSTDLDYELVLYEFGSDYWVDFKNGNEVEIYDRTLFDESSGTYTYKPQTQKGRFRFSNGVSMKFQIHQMGVLMIMIVEGWYTDGSEAFFLMEMEDEPSDDAST